MTLPINTAAVAHSHLQRITDAVKKHDADLVVTAQITPPQIERSSIGRPGEAHITFVAWGFELVATVRALGDAPRFRAADKPGDFQLTGYQIEINAPGMHRERIPLKKDGTFNYERIASTIGAAFRSARNEEARRARNTERTGDHGEFAKQLEAKLREQGLGYVSINDKATGGPLLVTLHSIQRRVSPEAAKELVDFLADWAARNTER